MANGWGGARPGAGRKPGSKVVRKVPLIPARAHRVTTSAPREGERRPALWCRALRVAYPGRHRRSYTVAKRAC